MTYSEGKKKMISLRLSEVEYEGLKTQYSAYGARNVSDLARLALQRIMKSSPDPPDAYAERLADLDHRLHDLESQVSQLVERNLAKV
jgi:hypothetical protein